MKRDNVFNEARASANNKGYMKKFTIEVSHASPGQLQTIAAELKIMANGWERFGPRIRINKQAVQPPALRMTPTETINKRA